MFTNNQIVKEWTVIKRAEDRYIGRNQKRVFFWLCKCNKCGKLQEVEQQRLKNPIKYNCCKICSLKLIKTKDYTGQKYNCKKCHKEVHDFNFHGPVNQQLQSTLEKIAEINTELLDINLKVKYEENKKQASNKFKIPTRQNSSV